MQCSVGACMHALYKKYSQLYSMVNRYFIRRVCEAYSQLTDEFPFALNELIIKDMRPDAIYIFYIFYVLVCKITKLRRAITVDKSTHSVL